MTEFFFSFRVDLIVFSLNYNIHILSFICLFLFIGAMGKSAQIGLHTWLPDAMEGPTPVSALLHAATMVTAGVFLIIRCSPVFEYAPTISTAMVFVGAITAFFAATTAVVQNDIKKIIAYSTCSQLGYMVFSCGFSGYSASLFHLVNHAFFKALLFLSAGAVIHGLSGEQDIRRMGGLAKILPFTYTMFLIGSLALIGFPFLSGFYSKDLILEIAYSKYTVNSRFVYWLGTVTAGLTSFYSFRLLYFVFFNTTNIINVTVLKNVREVSFGMAFPLMLLCLGSIFSGYLFKDIFVGLGSDFFKQSIFVRDVNVSLVDAEFLPARVKLLPTLFSLVGLCLGVYRRKGGSLLRESREVSRFLSNKWYFDEIYNYYLARRFLIFSYKFCFLFIDQYFLKFFGPIGISIVTLRLARSLIGSQGGRVDEYAFSMAYALLGCLFVVWLGNF
jgi:NADH-ubiquinone oxidoreductase chain 5